MLENPAKILLITTRKRSSFNPAPFGYSKTTTLHIVNLDNLDTRRLRGIGWDLVILEGTTMHEIGIKNEDAYHAIVNGCRTNEVTPLEL